MYAHNACNLLLVSSLVLLADKSALRICTYSLYKYKI